MNKRRIRNAIKAAFLLAGMYCMLCGASVVDNLGPIIDLIKYCAVGIALIAVAL